VRGIKGKRVFHHHLTPSKASNIDASAAPGCACCIEEDSEKQRSDSNAATPALRHNMASWTSRLLGAPRSKYDEPAVDDLIEDAPAANIGYNLQLIRGIPQNPLFDRSQFEDIIDNFATRDTDTYVCTYVKAGTTWCQQIVTLLLNNGEQGAKSYGETVPWLEALCAPPSTPLASREAPGFADVKAIDRWQGPRFFKTHATVSDLPRGKAQVKVIAVARNPKDTVVSLFHHASSKPEFGFDGSFDEFLRVFLAGNAENGSWFAHVNDWYRESRKSDRVLWLTYEGMICDHEGAVRKIASFLGLQVSDEMVMRTVAHSTIDSMRSNKKANIGLNHLRKGGIGGWRDTFTVSQSELFDKVYARKMADSGLVFDFGEGLVM